MFNGGLSKIAHGEETSFLTHKAVKMMMMMPLSYFPGLLWGKAHVLKEWFSVHGKCGIKTKWFTDLLIKYPWAVADLKEGQEDKQRWTEVRGYLREEPEGRENVRWNPFPTPFPLPFLPCSALGITAAPHPICRKPPNNGGYPGQWEEILKII